MKALLIQVNFVILLLMRVVKLILFSLALSLTGQIYAQAPKYSNEFLNIGVGARSLAMSGSTIASVYDGSSGYWNPAGLAGFKSDLQVGLMHAAYFANIANFDYGSFTKRIDSSSTFGVTIIRFGIDNIPNTIDLISPSGQIDYSKVTKFSVADYALLVSYARKMPVKGLKLGGNVKIIHRVVGEFGTAWGFGLDAGLQYKAGKYQLGATLRDVTSTFNAWSFTLSDRVKEVWTATGNEIPDNSIEITLPRLLTGIARRFEIGEKFSILGEAGMDFTFDGERNTAISTKLISGDPHAGLEAGFKDIVFVRAGIGNFQKVTEVRALDRTTFQPNIGIGLKIKAFTLDYALTDVGDKSVALYSNIFSLKIDINRK